MFTRPGRRTKIRRAPPIALRHTRAEPGQQYHRTSEDHQAGQRRQYLRPHCIVHPLDRRRRLLRNDDHPHHSKSARGFCCCHRASSCFSSSALGPSTCLGTIIAISAYKSPVRPSLAFTPWPFARSRVPLDVPGGTFSEIVPCGVGTSTFAPSAASATVTSTRATRSNPSRR